MKVEKHPIHPILKPYIKIIVVIESVDGMQNKLLPDTE
jgi:hypothetical protein